MRTGRATPEPQRGSRTTRQSSRDCKEEGLMKRVLLLAVAIVVMAVPALAQSKAMDTTEGLVSACRLYSSLSTFGPADSDKYTQAGFCIGYMAGFAHAASLTDKPAFCMPPTINLGEVVRA